MKHEYGRIDHDYGLSMLTADPDGPIFMVNLMKYHEVARYDDGDGPRISGKEADNIYNPSKILRDIGAAMVFVADVHKNHVDEDWDRIAIVRYPTRKSFIEMSQRKDFNEKHKHKEAAMLRTFVIGCRPVDSRLDTVEWPRPEEPRTIVMVVRRTDDRQRSLAETGGTGFLIEGTIIGDGRQWDTISFTEVADEIAADRMVADLDPHNHDDFYAMTLKTVSDAVTH